MGLRVQFKGTERFYDRVPFEGSIRDLQGT